MRSLAMDQVGLAVIGAGPWGATLARTVVRTPGARLRWICELDDQRRRQAAHEHPTARVTPAIADVLGDPEVVAAIVAVEAPQHHRVGLDVLTADRHLLVEKPLALSVDHAAALCDAASRRNRVLTVGHLLLHHPAVRRAREILQAGTLGDPLYFESRRSVSGPSARRGSAWWTLASHDVSLAIHLFDAIPVAVCAVSRDDAAGVDLASFATLRFADGRLAHIHAARCAAAKERRFSIAGTSNSLSVDELEPVPSIRIQEHASQAANTTLVETLGEELVDPLLAQCARFTSGVARGDTAVGNSAHALAVVRVLEAGARSMQAGGAPVPVT